MALRNPIELQLAVSAVCGGGVLEKFPTLKVAFLEGNCAWLPWLPYRLAERAELHGALTDVSLSRKPSEYFLDQCYISVDVESILSPMSSGAWATTTSSSPRTTRTSTPTTRTRWRSSWRRQG